MCRRTIVTAAPEVGFQNESFLATSFDQASMVPFPDTIQVKLSLPLNNEDIEVKPDGILYFPEIKYRRRLNDAFGSGGWALVPRGPHTILNKRVSREYGLFCLGRFVSQARGEQEYFNDEGIPTATEGAKSNALMRCCKDLLIASELWDPSFIREFKKNHVVMVQGTHYKTGMMKWLWKRKDSQLDFPYREVVNGKK